LIAINSHEVFPHFSLEKEREAILEAIETFKKHVTKDEWYEIESKKLRVNNLN